MDSQISSVNALKFAPSEEGGGVRFGEFEDAIGPSSELASREGLDARNADGSQDPDQPLPASAVRETPVTISRA
jgi:hypothetical protein